MDHNEAVRLQAVEKYLLGKLPKEQHAEYEEHYFDCSACAEEIKATVAFMESARQIVSAEALEPIAVRAPAPAVPGFFSWLRPASPFLYLQRFFCSSAIRMGSRSRD